MLMTGSRIAVIGIRPDVAGGVARRHSEISEDLGVGETRGFTRKEPYED
jgi:hypothetical protein